MKKEGKDEVMNSYLINAVYATVDCKAKVRKVTLEGIVVLISALPKTKKS